MFSHEEHGNEIKIISHNGSWLKGLIDAYLVLIFHFNCYETQSVIKASANTNWLHFEKQTHKISSLSRSIIRKN